jgi:hypothetical protein
MADGAPMISILMPVYNGLPYLREAIGDLLVQTFDDFELVVVDDGSSDGTREVLAEFSLQDERVRVIRNETNLGLPKTLNRGLAQCRGKWIARADADDRYPRDRLERQIQFLRSNPEVGLVSCAVRKMNASGFHYKAVFFPTDDRCIRLRELFVNSFSHPGAMFDRELAEAVGGYDPSYWAAEDADFWARLAEHTKLANLPVPLVHYRTHGTSFMHTRGAEGERLSLSVRQRLLSTYLDRQVGMDEARSIVGLYRGSAGLSRDEMTVGRAGLREVLRRARDREESATVRFFKREVARSMLKQAVARFGDHRDIGFQLLKEALRWDALCLIRQAARYGVGLAHRALFSEHLLVFGSMGKILPYLKQRRDAL